MTSTSDRFSTCPDRVIQAVHRAEWGRLLSLLVARTRRLDLAEDGLSEAFARAWARWPSDGIPQNPASWIYTTAYRDIVGKLRAEAVAHRHTRLLAVKPTWTPPHPDAALDALPDERLQLILLCCHPALPRESRSALALRLVLGTPTKQIARLFLVSLPTMAARLTRAKKKIVRAGIPLGAPVEKELQVRLDEVCRTIYLAFTSGYMPGPGTDLLRADVAAEAVRLAQMLHHLVPEAPQVQATLALLMLQHSRRDARQCEGRLVTLDAQDRCKWHRDEIHAGLALVGALSVNTGYAEELRLQALIAGEHARAATAAVTDWASIARYYAELDALTGSPIVRLNRAIAVAEVDGPEAGLALVATIDLDERLIHRVAAVRAELARRAGDVEVARQAYREAVAACANDVERAHLSARWATLEAT